MASLAVTSIEADSLKNESGSDEACTKIWTVYTAEAEKHDKALMESWTRDMNGVLLFAALFSATLTAFIVESYQTLQPDPSDKIVALLATISRQISDGNASRVLIDGTPSVSFAPTTSHASISSIVCNILWFISLFLSLTCALLATLVEQWTRGFAQKTDRNQSPVIRAKIFSYLYSGLKAFGMHTLVDLIPLLLHTSLMMFFAGLVAFPIPINPVLVGVAATWTASIAVAYGLLTALPLFHPDSPYWTPLSGIIWRVLQAMTTLSSRNPTMRSDGAVGSMIGHIVKQATKASGDTKFRDVRALCWTAKTLMVIHWRSSSRDSLTPSGARKEGVIPMITSSPDYLTAGTHV
ncbi:hypothetical protein MVEN_02207700 [Mycena venus]|uniref:DUF6535 domain-containing protein n=1 Tax=Mycena venus TaxID=2733690 RepID=A0A8H6X7Q6_9AGAR|nr:hypothetical protein MVEN_02207700 [Mycena venus]